MPKGIEGMSTNEMSAEEQRIQREQVLAEMEAEESGEEIPVVENKPDSPEPGETPEEPETNPWEGVSPALKAQFDEMSAAVSTIPTLQQRLEQSEKRVGSITNQLRDAKAAEANALKKPSKEEMEAATETAESWEEFQSNFPEMAAVMEAQFKALREELGQTGGAGSESLANLRKEIENDMDGKLEIRLVEMKHKNFRKTKDSPEFLKWKKEQSPEIQTKIRESVRAEDVISILDSFEEHRKSNKSAAEIAQEREERLRNSELPAGKKAFIPKSEADLSRAELRNQVGKEVWADT